MRLLLLLLLLKLLHRTQHPNICHLNLAYATAATGTVVDLKS